MGLLILHLSDIHIATPKDDVLRRANAIAQATFKDLSLADALVVAVTGDIAYSGTREQYLAAKGFLSQMIATIRAERNIPIHVITCQGNHDCDFDAGTPDVRDAVLDVLSKTKPDDIKPSLIDVCVEVQAAFFSFRSELDGNTTGVGDKLWVTYKIPVGDRYVVFHCLNVAWMSKKKEPAASILFPTERYEALAKATTDTTVLCMHHPLNWFAQPSYRSFKRLIRRAAHLVLSGHEHQQGESPRLP